MMSVAISLGLFGFLSEGFSSLPGAYKLDCWDSGSRQGKGAEDVTSQDTGCLGILYIFIAAPYPCPASEPYSLVATVLPITLLK